MNAILKAFVIACKAHYKQHDKGGKPYILHPLYIAWQVHSKNAKAVALLHDILEDCDKFTLKDLYFLSNEQKEALVLLTHNDETPYIDYIHNIKQNPLAKEVKQQDLLQNLNLKRLKTIQTKDINRARKYLTALEILNE